MIFCLIICAIEAGLPQGNNAMSEKMLEITPMGEYVLVSFLAADVILSVTVKIADEMERFFKEQETPNLLVDLRNVRFMDSSGMGALVSMKKTIEKKGKRFALLTVKGDVLDIITITGMHKYMKTFREHEEAVSWLTEKKS